MPAAFFLKKQQQMKTAFINRTMQIMNEMGWDNSHSEAFIGSDTTKVEEHIVSVFVDAWRKAVSLLPKTYFTIKDFTENNIESNTDSGTGRIILPDDYYTLFSFRMRGWQKSLNTCILTNDSIASIQANEYTRGNFMRPVAILNKSIIKRRDDDGRNMLYETKHVLKYYSLPRGTEHVIEEAYYIPLMEPLNDETLISNDLFIPLAYLDASLVFSLFEKTDVAQVIEKTAIDLISK